MAEAPVQAGARASESVPLEPLGPALPKDEPRFAWERWSLLISLAVGIGLWWGIVAATGLPKFVLPTPWEVLQRLVDYVPTGQLQLHFETTIAEALLGGLLGVAFGLLSGYALAKSVVAEKLVGPYLVASQSVPVVAFTPILILWFGTGLTSKVIICAVIVFFPMTISTMVGLRSVDPGLIELMRTFRADRWQVLRMVELPAALPSIFGGLKVGGTLSILGAVVGEFVGAKRGLGFLVNYAAFQLDTPLMFVGLFCLVALGVAVFSLVSLAERRALHWRTHGLQ
ncbi:MAG TPA: ABC transporter permease [Chloroflexota bacterium]|nr:ABC transporter permease [Chloroflexota bacterium]